MFHYNMGPAVVIDIKIRSSSSFQVCLRTGKHSHGHMVSYVALIALHMSISREISISLEAFTFEPLSP
jgi:hypothetical protein